MSSRPFLALAVLIALLASCGDDRTALPIGTIAVDGNRIAVHGSCHDGRRLEAAEGADRVELTFSVDAVTGGDCFDCVLVELEAVVGDREVIDTTTGEPIPRDGDARLNDCFETP